MNKSSQKISIKNIDDFLTSLGYEEDFQERYEESEEDEKGEETILTEHRLYRRSGIEIKIIREYKENFKFSIFPENKVFHLSKEEKGWEEFELNSLRSFKEAVIILSNTDRFSEKMSNLENMILSIDNIEKSDSGYYQFYYKIKDDFTVSIWPKIIVDQNFVEFKIQEYSNRSTDSSFFLLFHIDDRNKINEIINCLKKISETMDMSHVKSL